MSGRLGVELRYSLRPEPGHDRPFCQLKSEQLQPFGDLSGRWNKELLCLASRGDKESDRVELAIILLRMAGSQSCPSLESTGPRQMPRRWQRGERMPQAEVGGLRKNRR